MDMSVSAMGNPYESYGTPRVENNPADILIAEEQLSQINGYQQNVRNGEDGQGVIRTADGALSGIADSLQRMRELSVRASSSALYTKEDRKIMQQEINQLKEHISDIAKNTHFNTRKLLDGSMADLHLALNPEGGGLSIQMADATLEGLGIADYDVTGDFDISKLDEAIKRVGNARASLGAQGNALDHSISVGSLSAENLTASYSRLSDMDIEKYLSEKQKREIMDQYRYFAVNSQRQQKESMIQKMFM